MKYVPAICISPSPHQVHLKEQNTPTSGTLLAFSEEFLLSEGQSSWKKLPILSNPEQGYALKLSETDKDFLHQLFGQIQAEYQQQKDWKKGMLLSYLKIFLVYLSRLYTSQFNIHPSPDNDPSLVGRMRALTGTAVGATINTNQHIHNSLYAIGTEIVGGFIILHAASLEEATDTAQTCPIFEFDGYAEVREMIFPGIPVPGKTS